MDFSRKLPPPDCEYTAPGSVTEAIDCWEPADHRHVANGVTTGVFCGAHSPEVLRPNETVELIDMSIYHMPGEGQN